MSAAQTKDGGRQKMNAKGDLTSDNGIQAILFVVLAVLVMVFIVKFYLAMKPVPEWSRALAATEQAINSLDPDNTELVRKVNIKLVGYQIKGLSQESCPENEEMPSCICACTDPGCSNAMKEEKKFCRNVKYNTTNFVLNPSSDDIITYSIGLNETTKEVIERVSIGGAS